MTKALEVKERISEIESELERIEGYRDGLHGRDRERVEARESELIEDLIDQKRLLEEVS